jgi:uncharacterized protein
MSEMKIEKLKIQVSDSIGSVTAESLVPSTIKAVMTLAHGAGAGMDHPFMKKLAKALAEVNIGTVRFNFAYIEKGKKMPDPPAIAEKTVGVVLQKTHELFPGVPLLAGGKSFGGRMFSQFTSKNQPGGLRGLVFFGFPLHAPGKPSDERAAHLTAVNFPMLFLQGTRDALASLDLMRGVTERLKRAELVQFEGADHSFKAGKKEFIPELAEHTSRWFDGLSGA